MALDRERCRALVALSAEAGAKVSIETTGDEIVSVEVAAAAGSEPYAACIEEAVWTIRLDSNFDRDAFFSLTL